MVRLSFRGVVLKEVLDELFDYQVLHVDDFDADYIVKTKDQTIPEYMKASKRTWAHDEMDFVLRNLGGVSDGYIFDCGANIGTTTIYLSKATKDKLRVIAFEPVMTNYRLLKANCAFNYVENVTLENKALNFENTTGEMLIWEANYGACAVKGIRDESKNYQMEPKIQNVNFVKLDDYCVNNNISAEKIRLFWVDTEGFEANVIKGALTILNESDALTYMEFNYEIYKKNDQLNEICDYLEKIYKKFIVYEEQRNGEKRFRDISELRKVKETCNILFSKCVNWIEFIG